MNLQRFDEFDPRAVARLRYWCEAREKARREGKSGDPNIDDWRYCNVRREDDAVTKWIHNSAWMMPVAQVVPNLLTARLFNNPDTLRAMEPYMAYRSPAEQMAHWHGRIEAYRTLGNRVFNPAYIVSTNGAKMGKVAYVLYHILQPVYEQWTSDCKTHTLQETYEKLLKFNGVGSFIAAQVIADLKHVPGWRHLPDRFHFCAPGPGSIRGLNRLRGLAPDAERYKQEHFKLYLHNVAGIISSVVKGDVIDNHNAQNCLCEFDKYMRLVSGEGRPKQRYRRT
jgi:hypothetical protein